MLAERAVGPACGLLDMPCPTGFACTPLERRLLPNGITEFCYRASDNAVYVPAGDVWMGCNPEKDYFPGGDCSLGYPQFLVTTRPYIIHRTPVTTQDYLRCVAVPGAGCEPWNTGFDIGKQWNPAFADLSVRGLTPHSDALQYCRWLAAESGLAWRLCSNSEWEKAALGGCETYEGGRDLEVCRKSVRTFPWGDNYPECDLVATVIECDMDEPEWPGYWYGLEVGSSPAAAGPYGVLDMWGGWEELVADCQSNVSVDSAGRAYPPTDGSAWVHECEYWSRHGEPRPVRVYRSGGYYFNPDPAQGYSYPTWGWFASEEPYPNATFRCCADWEEGVNPPRPPGKGQAPPG
jgi:formylglycine-generating enzyme required for sulfatase activity